MIRTPETKGTLAILLAATVWGTTGTAATYAPDVSSLAIGAVAMGGGGALQSLLAARPIWQARDTLAQHGRLLGIGVLAIVIYPLAFYASMALAGVAVGTVLSIGLAPLFSAAIEWRFEGRRMTRRWMFGAIIGIGGAVILCLAKAKGHGSADVTTGMELLGLVLGVVAAATYALYSWVAYQLMRRGVPTRAAMGSLFGGAAIGLLPVLLWTGAPFLQSSQNASVAVYMAVVPMFLGYMCFGYGLARVPASVATTLTLLEPVVAAVLAVVVVGEALSSLAWTGIALIMLSLCCLTMPTSVVAAMIKRIGK